MENENGLTPTSLGWEDNGERWWCCGVVLPTPVDNVGLTSVEDVAVRRFADVQKEDFRQ